MTRLSKNEKLAEELLDAIEVNIDKKNNVNFQYINEEYYELRNSLKEKKMKKMM